MALGKLARQVWSPLTASRPLVFNASPGAVNGFSYSAAGARQWSQKPIGNSQKLSTAESFYAIILADVFAKFTRIAARAAQAPTRTMYTNHGERSERGLGSGW